MDKIILTAFTLRDFIIVQLQKTKNGLSCTQLAERAMKTNLVNNYSRKANITASFSSIIAKLRKEGLIKLSRKKAIRGGNVYLLKQKQ